MKEKLTMQDFLEMNIEDLQTISIPDFVLMCENNNLDFAEVIKNIKYKFDVKDQEMQNKQTIYCNLKDNVVITKDNIEEISCDEYLEIKQAADNQDSVIKFITDCLLNGLGVAKIQRYYRVGFNKGAHIIDKLVYEKIIEKTETNYKVLDRKAFVQKVCSGDILDVAI